MPPRVHVCNGLAHPARRVDESILAGVRRPDDGQTRDKVKT